MRLISAASAALALTLLSPLAVLAQSAPPTPTLSVPRLVNISAVFQPADGQPPAPVEVVTLSIYAEQQGGTPLWQEIQTVTVDAAGRFTVVLGASHPDGLPPGVFASGEARWMSLLFARAGEIERPRVRITSVPYALKASDAETLGGRPASDYLLAPTAGDDEVRRAGGTSTADASAAATGEPLVAAALVLPGTTNFLAKYVNGADVGNSGVFENGGAVGLGTTSPFDRFHVRFTNTNGGLTGLAVQNLGNTTTSYSGMLFYDQNGALGQFQGFNNVTHEYRINNIATNASINFMTGSVSRFFVAPNGNIGIGTTSPAVNLEVSNALGLGNGNITAATYSASGQGPVFSGRKARGTFAAPTGVLGGDSLAIFRGFGYATTNYGTAGASIIMRAAENWTDTAQGAAIHFFTTPTGTTTAANRMTLDQFGNLGLGTTGPVAALDMVKEAPGPLEINLTRYAGASDSGEPNVLLRTARGTRAAPSAVQFGDELGGIGATGYGTTGFGEFGAGIGAIAAENWTDTAQGAALLFGATPLGSNQAEANMVIMPGGNVGIGTLNDFPTITDKLQVFGDIRVGTSGTNGCLKNFNGDALAGSCASDRRYKKDITPFGPALGPLTALQPMYYFWRAAEFPAQNFGDGRSYGLIAQDVEQVLPELVVTGADGFKAVDYSKLPLLTIQAVKELKAELKAENDTLKHRVAELERLFAEMAASAARR